MNNKMKVRLLMEKRDAKILADLFGGQSVADIALREEISPQRIYQIGNAHGWVSKREIARRLRNIPPVPTVCTLPHEDGAV